ncbi:MAG TPA: threonine/serine exporter family protein [Spirochaetales bacterium]|nr:threonine/serine exporter family protein [Spirochaetales bacterium]
MNAALLAVFAILKGPLYAAAGTLAISVLFGLRSADALLASCGAALGWTVRQAIPSGASIAFSSFAAAVATGLYSELVARFRHRPATVYMVSSIVPLVPGGGMYYTMLASVEGNTSQSLEIGMTALMTAFAVATGLAVANTVDKLVLRPLFEGIGRCSPGATIGGSARRSSNADNVDDDKHNHA